MIATVRFYAHLNDHLLPGLRQRSIDCDLPHPVPVREVIEALGVPSAEVDLIVANGEPVAMSYLPREGDRIAVYPPFVQLQIHG